MLILRVYFAWPLQASIFASRKEKIIRHGGCFLQVLNRTVDQYLNTTTHSVQNMPYGTAIDKAYKLPSVCA